MKIVHIDMDDTLCHFTRAAEVAKARFPQIAWPQSQYGFFTSLEPIAGAIDYVTALREFYDVYILSRPSVMNPLCYTEKRVWVEKYFGLEFCNKLILSPNKGLLRGDYLIDDVVWSDFQGEQILYGSVTYPSWENVYQKLYTDHLFTT
jgi:5'-nucleotidase